MTTEELAQARTVLVGGRKVCVLNLAAFSMSVGNIAEIASADNGLSLKVDTDKGDQASYELQNPVNFVTTPTGYRFEGDNLVLQVDFMPD